ncbi:hypothetical protein L0Y49_02920 [bacterium]|nr:hypothetical protein [bacterium]
MINVSLWNRVSEEELNTLGKNYAIRSFAPSCPDCIIVRSYDMNGYFADHSDFVEGLKSSLKAVVRAGVETSNIPVEKLTSWGVPVFNTPGTNANAVAELTIWALLSAARNTPAAIQFMKGDVSKEAVEKEKKKFAGVELARKTLGILGFAGNIGSLVSHMAGALNMRLKGYDPLPEEQRKNKSHKFLNELSELDAVAGSEFVTLHLPLAGNEGMFSYKHFAAMQDGVHLINFARPEIVNSGALYCALAAGKVATYHCDGFVADERIRAFGPDRVVLTPHIGASTAEAEFNSARAAADRIREFFEYGIIKNSVNFPDISLEPNGGVRFVVPHQNTPGKIARITSIVEEAGLNISGTRNKTRDSIAIFLFDVDTDADNPLVAQTLARIQKIPGIMNARVI